MIKNKPAISVIIPAYNEEDTIDITIKNIMNIEDLLPSMEIIVIDDGSTDKTAEKIEQFKSIKFIRHKKNMGKGAALKTGINEAIGEIIVIQDADLEYPVEHIPLLLKQIYNGSADVVYGSRFLGSYEGMSHSHFFGNRVLSLVTSILYGTHITDVMTGHKIFSCKVFENMTLREKGFSIEIELTSKILKAGWRIVEVPIKYSIRSYGKAKINYIDGLNSLLKLLIYKIQ